VIPLGKRGDLRRDRPICAYFMWFYLVLSSYKKLVRSRDYAFLVSYIVLLNFIGEYTEWTLLGHQNYVGALGGMGSE
jgi:hypothetical protein